ncbi:hypothetical protein M422DRAFT_59161 [Sphaerobolus stellatus SS14]|nr:hypothetical protein M422DRAFT_59161 [Sphaerobolus stellatus SS14]
MSLNDALSKIRPHTSSNLAHQKAPANLLTALESTLTEQGTEKNATAYFASLLTTLEAAKANPTFGEGDVLPAILYLLALVAPFVSHAVIRSHLSAIMALTLPLCPSLVPYAPALRSHLSIISAVIQALDSTQLDTPSVRQAFKFALELTVDPRPKVRRRAADLVREVLEHPPAPVLVHPYTERVGEWVTTTLTSVSSGVAMFGKNAKKEGSDAPEVGIHLIAMVKPIVFRLPDTQLPVITSSLLALPRLGNPYLSQSAYGLLASLVSVDTTENPDMSTLISALLSAAPIKTDSAQSPAWLELLRAAFDAAPVKESLGIDQVFKTVFAYLEAADASTRTGVTQALGALLSKSVTPSMVEAAVSEISQKKQKSLVSRIVLHVRTSFDALPYARAMPQMLTILASLIRALIHRPANATSDFPPTAAELLLLDVVQRVGELRIKKGFEHKESADEVLKAAMSVLGPEVIMRVLPLGLLPEDRSAGAEPHAYLLPLLVIPHPSPLTHFVNYFVPLSERMFDLNQTADVEGRANEAKMWDVLIGQIWTGLVGYCYNTRDLPEAFNATFAQLLSQILYNQPQLRPAVLKALKIIVESNLVETPGLKTYGDAQRNIAHLRTQAESWFAVLFNVYGSVGQDGKGTVGDAISTWVKIAAEKEIVTMYKKVVSLFKQNLTNPAKNPPKGSDAPNMTLMAQDLLILLLPELPLPQCQELWALCTSSQVTGSDDTAIQKRGYRILSKLVQTGKLSSVQSVEDVLTQLTATAETVGAPAKRDRITLLALLLPSLPSTSFHIIPTLIPEAVLATKEPAERTRSAAFDLIVAMGTKMKDGGIVKRSRLDGMDDEETDEVQATIEEYITMVAAGLAGATPHMISATITAISRLVFEFKDDISPSMLEEILSTILVFVTSANREIVKSALGFIKLCTHTLPVDLVMSHLKELVPGLLNWSGDHKNHFKVKVRHIFERMIRRFGWDAVYNCVGSEPEERERGKILLNIKKRKDRAKRKKARAAEQDGDESDDEGAAPRKTGDAFEDVLYGSESEIDESDDEADQPTSRSKKAAGSKRQQDKGVRIRVHGDEPMDLLHGVAEKLTAGNKNRRRMPGQDASHFKQDEETGRMIVEEEKEAVYEEMEEDVAGTAYKETITSVDGFTRGPNGRIKFNKDTKKRRHANEEDEDVEMGEAQAASSSKPNKKRKKEKEIRLGQEFKAKHAGGDVKKGGVDPYAYLPLSQASAKKKGGKAPRVNVVGRR